LIMPCLLIAYLIIFDHPLIIFDHTLPSYCLFDHPLTIIVVSL
jgi:hypothetical protein